MRIRRPYNLYTFYRDFGLRKDKANIVENTKTSSSNYLNTINRRPYTIIKPRIYEEAIYRIDLRE